MKQRFLKIGLGLIIAIGFFMIYKSIFLDTALDDTNPLNTENVINQTFWINSSHDTVLIGTKGTLIIIRKNSFNDCRGNQITGNINIVLKEVYSLEDIVKSGLSTTSNKSMLISDGMLYLNVFQNNAPICLDDSATISLITPTDTLDKRMKQFTGRIINQDVNWVNPTEMVSSEAIEVDMIPSILGSWNQDETTTEEALALGLISSDTIALYNDGFDKSYYDSITEIYRFDDRLNNILEVSELGWLNIDRFVESYETTTVDFSIEIANREVFPTIFSKLIFPDLKSILNGYDINNTNVVFGKSLNEKVNLPLGSRATILVTSYVDKKPYYYFKEITIMETQDIKINMKKTSESDLFELIDSRFN